MNQYPIFILEDEPLLPDISYPEIGMPDALQDYIRYVDYLIEIGETILHTGETRGIDKIRKSVYNEFRDFNHAFKHVYKELETEYITPDNI